MSTDTKVANLIINKGLTKAELNEKYQQGLIGDNELSIVDTEENVVQVDEMPVASASNVDSIVQFSGETTEDYTNGYFYKCTYSDGVYSWTQINVQPGGGGAGIEWKTIVDLPATYSAGTYLDCPQFIVQGGLPDGNYEFYYQVKTRSNSGDQTAPFGVATYKIVCRFYHNNGWPYMIGSIAPVVDGNWIPSPSYKITNRTVYGCFFEDSGNFIIWGTDYPLISDIGDWPNTFVPECFKLSAIKNTDTGDEYIATGIEPDGQQHYFSPTYSGSLYMDTIQLEPGIPVYFTESLLDYGYWYGLGNIVTIDTAHRAACCEADISLLSSNGGKWHIIIENTPDSYKINLLEASGDLANVQIGYDENCNKILYLNTPSGATGTIRIFEGLKGSTDSVSFYNISQPTNFTQFTLNAVGGDISTSNYGSILQYTGVTDSNYTNGYFYKANGTPTTIPASMLCNETSGLGLTITCNDIEGFITALAADISWDRASVQDVFKSQVTVWQYTQDSNTLNWNWYGNVNPSLISYFDIVGPEVPASTTIQWTVSNYVAEETVITNPSWDRVDVQPAGATYTAGTGIDITNNVVSVDNTVLVNNQTGSASVNIKGLTNDKSNAVVVGSSASVTNNQAVAVGWGSQAGYDCTAIGARSLAYDDYSTAIGFGATVPYGVAYAIQLGNGTNNTSGTMAVALSTDGSTWTNYELLSSNGTIPEARLADTTNAAQGQVLTLDANLNAVWQAGGSGGGLPSQTGNAGKFLTTDGTDASWSDKPLVNVATGSRSIAIGGTGQISSIYSTSLGTNADPAGNFSVSLGDSSNSIGGGTIAIGYAAKTSAAGAIQLNTSVATATNSDANTVKIANANGNFEMMSADGTVPTARLTKVNSIITLTAAGWSSNTQTVNVTGMTVTGVVFVSPDPTDQADYTSAGILCTAQAAGTLTFTCDSVPSGDIDVNVVML